MKQEDLQEQVALTDEFLGDISEAYWGYQGEDPYGPVRAIIGLLIPPGHVVVPVEPTREMLNAAPAREDPGEESMYATIYRAMLSAAPKVTT